MYMKVFAHGKGRGELATNYLVREDYANRDTLPPEVLRGDPNLTADLINSIDREWKYSAGVLSWHHDDEVSKEQEEAIMNDFEKVAFAGLEAEQYNVLWVRHTHANHHELHFVIPRMELTTGKAFNPCPPNWQKDFDPFRDYHNIKENWARPDDPERQRLYTPPEADIKYNRLKRWGKEVTKTETDKIRMLLIEYTTKRIESGIIQNRNDIVKSFQELGLSINRQGKDYITVHEQESNKKIRLKGGIFNESWRITAESTRETEIGQGNFEEQRSRELNRIGKQLEEIYKKRCDYNRGRFKSNTETKQLTDQEKFQDIYTSPNLLNHIDNRNSIREQSSYINNDLSNQSITKGNITVEPKRTGENRNSSKIKNMGYNTSREQWREVYSPSERNGNREQLEHWPTESNQTEITQNKGESHERNSEIHKGNSNRNSDGANTKATRTREHFEVFERANQRLENLSKQFESTIREFSQVIQRFTEKLPRYLQTHSQIKEETKNIPSQQLDIEM